MLLLAFRQITRLGRTHTHAHAHSSARAIEHALGVTVPVTELPSEGGRYELTSDPG